MSVDNYDYPVNHIHGQFTDKCGNNVVLRTGYFDGKRGFGQDKAEHKHGLKSTNDIVELIANNECGEAESATTRTYLHTVWPKDCTNISATKLRCEQGEPPVTLFMVHDSRPVEDGNAKGVITVYCQGYNPRCPGWVDNPDQIRSVNGMPWGDGNDDGTVQA